MVKRDRIMGCEATVLTNPSLEETGPGTKCDERYALAAKLGPLTRVAT
jgi:hypothetical protein